jgi:hypothetical protein
MKNSMICLIILVFILACKKGEKQKITLLNESSKNIYFLLSKEKLITNISDISNVLKMNLWQENESQSNNNAKRLNEEFNPKNHFIKKGDSAILITSESTGIFLNSITIKSIIKERFNGVLNIYIIAENDLLNHSEHEIIDKKLFKLFKSVTANDINEDETVFKLGIFHNGIPKLDK